VSRFFAFLVETGRLPKTADNPGRGFTFNTKSVARKQRDMWTGEELTKLFASPVWTGCNSYFRARPGEEIIRDARFWLPLLGLYHGNHLEEFAQLRREDVALADGVPYLRVTDEDGPAGGTSRASTSRHRRNERAARRWRRAYCLLEPPKPFGARCNCTLSTSDDASPVHTSPDQAKSDLVISSIRGCHR
jgi:hypothetical protein